MAIRLDKPWQPMAEAGSALKGHMGVFQLANEAGEILLINYAGGRSLFGLKGEVIDQAKELSEVTQFRVEVTTAYMSRFRELMMVHHADHGEYPKHNPPVNLGRLSPV